MELVYFNSYDVIVEEKKTKIHFISGGIKLKRNEEIYVLSVIGLAEIKFDNITEEIYNKQTKFPFVAHNGKTLIIGIGELIENIQAFKSELDKIFFKYAIQSETYQKSLESKINTLIKSIESKNYENLIDAALDNRDEEMFYQLTQKIGGA